MDRGAKHGECFICGDCPAPLAFFIPEFKEEVYLCRSCARWVNDHK